MPAKKTFWFSLILSLWIGLMIGLAGCETKKDSNPNKQKTKISSTQGLKESPQEGFLAPQFTLQDLRGNKFSLRDFKGKVVILNFWASWCGPCRREIPSLERLYQLRKNEGFEILAVSVDRGSPSKVKSFVAAHRMSFPVLVDPRGEVGKRYWTRAIPTSFLLDKNQVIRWKVVGAKEWDDPYVLNRVDQLLSE